MNSGILSSLEAAALEWLEDSGSTEATTVDTMEDGTVCIHYWHTDHFNGALIVLDRLTAPRVVNLIAALPGYLEARQQREKADAIAAGLSEADADDAARSFPTLVAICAPFDAIDDGGYEAYQRATGTFDQPLVVAMQDGDVWEFHEEEVQ